MRDDVRDGWKVLTHDWRSPLQGGDPLGPPPPPVLLPTVKLDTGGQECAPGWNYCADAATALRIAGLWPTGRPSVLLRVRAASDAIARGEKRRASTLTLTRLATEAETADAIQSLSAPFAPHAETMTREQLAWRAALARPRFDPAEVEASLALALSARALPWRLEQYPAAWAARAAGAARDARAAGAARDAWAAWDARDAWAAWAARDAWDAWDARDAWAAWAAWAALTIVYVRLMGWQAGEPDQYTVGIRDAYSAGLGVALPTGPATLGWAMEPAP